jgi:hypothetical protein
MAEPAAKTLNVINKRAILGMGRRNIFIVAPRLTESQKYN